MVISPPFPRGDCACGRNLAEADDLGGAASHQLMDTRAVTAGLTQCDERTVARRCGAGARRPSPAPAGESGTVTYGPNLQAWCYSCWSCTTSPVDRCAGIIEALTGTRPSDRFVYRKRYLLVACTSLLTYFFLGDRSMRSFDAFVFPDLSANMLAHDRYQNYDAIPGQGLPGVPDDDMSAGRHADPADLQPG